MTTLITGANRGIGRALVEQAAARGEAIIGTARGALPADVPGVEWQGLEVTDPASQRALAARLAGRPIDLLVCNAGVLLDWDQDLDSGYPVELWAETLAVNVTGVFLTVQALLPNVAAARGKIAIISSQMGAKSKATAGNYAYRASKAAASNIGFNLAHELRARGIAVGVYHPGWVVTELGTDAAEISTDESARGLWQQFAALDLASTGCFRTWDGRDHPL